MTTPQDPRPVEPLSALAGGEETLELRRHYLQNLVHELATPLTPLLGYIRLFQNRALGDLNELQNRCVHRMHRSAIRLRRLLDDFSHLLQMESGMYRPEPLRVSLHDLVIRALHETAFDAEDETIEVIAPDEEEIDRLWIEGDEQKLTKALEHLLLNALKFNSAGGKLLLRLARDPVGGRDGVAIEVFDTGVGIPAEDVKQVFEPFFQCDHSETRRFQGAGLGLALVRWIAEVHGGSIEIESPPKEQPEGHFFRGVRAILRLPLADSPASTDSTAA